MSGNWKFETLDDNGAVVEERIRPVKMRQTYRQEMKYLLEMKPDLSLEEIFTSTGFESAAHFSRFFKEKMGIL